MGMGYLDFSVMFYSYNIQECKRENRDFFYVLILHWACGMVPEWTGQNIYMALGQNEIILLLSILDGIMLFGS